MVPPAFCVAEASANKDRQSQHWYTVRDFFWIKQNLM